MNSFENKLSAIKFDKAEILNFTFLFAFLVLTFSVVITGIESFKTESTQLRSVLTIETFVSLVAGYVYYKFLSGSINRSGTNPLDAEGISFKTNNGNHQENTISYDYRYLDWFITTPFLLLSLFIILNDGEEFPWFPFLGVVILNILMLAGGYLAETGRISKIVGWTIGAIALFFMFYIIYETFHPGDKPIFWFFVVLWSLYGIVFFVPYEYNIILYSILDVIAKAGLGFWTWLVSVGLVQNF